MLRIFLGAILLAGGGLIGWLSLSGDGVKPAVASVISMSKILVASEPLQAGTLLKDTDLKERELPSSDVTSIDLVATDDNRAEVRGAMLRTYLEAGQLVHRTDILRPRDRGFLAAVLSPGTRAISIGVDATTGASGLISPGDLVDIILTQEFARGETTAGRRVVAETVLNKVRVIAVDQQIAQGAPTSSSQSMATMQRVASNVSLEVTPEQAAKVVVASHLGKLTLTVRSIDGEQAKENAFAGTASTVPNPGVIRTSTSNPMTPSVFGSDVSAALSNDAPAPNPQMRVIQGDTVSDTVFH